MINLLLHQPRLLSSSKCGAAKNAVNLLSRIGSCDLLVERVLTRRNKTIGVDEVRLYGVICHLKELP